jgi:hypothetical protein
MTNRCYNHRDAENTKMGIEKRRCTMSEEDLELLITLDDPVEAPEDDTFHHLDAEKVRARHDQWAEESGGSQ